MQHEEHFDDQNYPQYNRQGAPNGTPVAMNQGQYTQIQNRVSTENRTNRIQQPILEDHILTDHSVGSRFRFREMEEGKTLTHLENLKHMQTLIDLHDME